MEGELPEAPRGSSGLLAGDALGDSPCALLPAEALALDGDENHLEAHMLDRNSLSPTMPRSPLWMINQVKCEDEPNLKDLFIMVDDPESHVTTIETIITYRVATQTSCGEFDSSELEVRRRYQDSLWLKGKLEGAHPL
ncbi:hypothetical protein QTO34_017973 [Cnephaeus nilssonii]|uniref:Uncharacterized protein n=1 Tax=Cnephaeus nilssonii TaxID=3371016 RepID=A0AA40I1Z7_CNENI|nr:hypothetical protein QTO34_017973 [Eptesicus nilssonii]